ncbi:FtsX-like permease family protein [Pseudolysobacter antarcticus]|uniref:FtsX-like permease family protein n=1 Tax=Pseudolysobacter antarcticus TaxID=2511995 RepID=A0A411HMJ5_9GAMM|nr:ABC transporter permease [Pseudolysobacter antarcticus]QBB71700.1 FtsX-like permease family protein [Pseudolysobacter antarcticus]
MSLRDTLATAWQAICRQPYIGAQAFFGLAIGTAALLGALALGQVGIAGNDAHSAVPSRLEIFSENSYAPAAISDGRQTVALTTADVAAIRRLDGVSSAAASLLRFSRVNYADSSLPISVYAVDADYFAAHGWALTGAFSAQDFSDANNADANSAVILGSSLSAEIFAEADPTGKIIQLGGSNFHISGVVSAKDASTFFGDYATAVFMPLPTAQGLFAGSNELSGDAIGQISVRIVPGADVASLQQQIRSLLRRQHGLASNQQDDFQLRDFSALDGTNQHSAVWSPRMLVDIAMIALLLGAAALSRIMLLSVDDRAREIGLRIATGADPRAIQSRFLAESVMIAVAAGIFGMLLAAVSAFWLEQTTDHRLHLSAVTMLTTVILACAIGALCGLLPANKASRLNPAVVLRDR